MKAESLWSSLVFWSITLIISIAMLIFWLSLACRAAPIWVNAHDQIEKNRSGSHWRSLGEREITSFNAVWEQCDAEPDIGAGGRVAIKGKPTGRWFACNWLAFGTKIMIPAITGDLIWTCRDRTAKKVGHRIDLLMPIGKTIGLRHAEVLIWQE